ncbi:MAG TPA: hypothetical protein VF990_08410 [Candidatus Dormibacteraeota bacterium]
MRAKRSGLSLAPFLENFRAAWSRWREPFDLTVQGLVCALPIKHDLALAYLASLVVAVLIAIVSLTELIFGYALYEVDPKVAAGVAASAAGLLVPGFLDQDVFNLVVARPILLGSTWLPDELHSSACFCGRGRSSTALYIHALPGGRAERGNRTELKVDFNTTTSGAGRRSRSTRVVEPFQEPYCRARFSLMTIDL